VPLRNTPFADMGDAEGPTQAAGLAAFDITDCVLPLLGAFLDGCGSMARAFRATSTRRARR